MKTRIADLGAVTSIGLFGTTWLADLDLFISIIAGLVAIVAGVAAASYHYTRRKILKNQSTAKNVTQKTD